MFILYRLETDITSHLKPFKTHFFPSKHPICILKNTHIHNVWKKRHPNLFRMMTLAVISVHDYVPVLSKFGAMNLYKQKKKNFFFPKNEIEFSLFKKEIQYVWCRLPVAVALIRNSNSKYFIYTEKSNSLDTNIIQYYQS